MHTAVHLALEEIELQLLREESLGANGAQRLTEALVTDRLVRLERGLNSTRRQHGLHLARLAKRQLRRACRDDQRIRAIGRRHAPAPAARGDAKSSHVASTRPAMVDIDASAATSSPRARAASLVMGPIVTAGMRAAASAPTASTNALTADAEV